MTQEEIKDKLNMSLAQRLTMDLSKCEVNFILQGLMGFRDEKGNLFVIPFTMRTESELLKIAEDIFKEAREYKTLAGISFAQSYLNYSFVEKNEQKVE